MLKFNKNKKGILAIFLIVVCIFAVGFASNSAIFAIINDPTEGNETFSVVEFAEQTTENDEVISNEDNILLSATVDQVVEISTDVPVVTNDVFVGTTDGIDFPSISEAFAELFAELAEFGVIFDKDTNNIYYQGQLVRALWNIDEDENGFVGAHLGSVEKNGSIDIHTVRDDNGVVVRIKTSPAN